MQRWPAAAAQPEVGVGLGRGSGMFWENIYIYTDTHLLSPWDWYIYLLWARKGFGVWFVLMLRLKGLVKEEGAHVDPS